MLSPVAVVLRLLPMCTYITQPAHCENAFFKMDNVLIDDRRIHVDFSQSVAKVKWNGKGELLAYHSPPIMYP